ncbi:biotin transporter BioY [Eubacteriaceae bacterium ES3]|nr:biotin transporter BioY [Eubacteriaceae bacterium ES3]
MKKIIDIKTLSVCALFTALIVIGAYIKIPLPAIPFTLQTLFVIMAGMLLGSRKGLLSVLAYIFIGLIGLPVFSGGGGLFYVFKPSFGYILGFALAAYVSGKIVEMGGLNIKTLILAATAGSLAIYVIGLPWYYMIMNYYLNSPLTASGLMVTGFVVFIPTIIIKGAIAVVLTKRLYPLVKRQFA